MRSINSLASWRWCLLAVFAVGCAHSSAGPAAEPAPAAATVAESSPPGTSSEARMRKQEKVRRLMAATGAEASGRMMLDMMTQHFQRMSTLPPGFMEKFREVAEEESMVDMLVPVYMKHFTEEDLDAALAFHESPAGKRFLAAQPLVMQEAKEVGEQWGVRLAEKTLQALKEEARQTQPARHEGQQL